MSPSPLFSPLSSSLLSCPCLQPRLLSRYDAELELLLDALLWRFSVWLGRSTPACALLNLRLRDEASSRRMLRSGHLEGWCGCGIGPEKGVEAERNVR